MDTTKFFGMPAYLDFIASAFSVAKVRGKVTWEGESRIVTELSEMAYCDQIAVVYPDGSAILTHNEWSGVSIETGYGWIGECDRCGKFYIETRSMSMIASLNCGCPDYGFVFDDSADVLSYDQWDWDSEIPQWARDMMAELDREGRIEKLVELWLKEELDDVDSSISNWQDVDSMTAALMMFTTQEEDEEAARREIAILEKATHYASGAPYTYPGHRVRLSEPIL